MTIDKVTQLCLYNDYPLYRYHFQKYRNQINQLYVYPSKQHGSIDFEDFEYTKFLGVTWVSRVPINYGVEDWRQAETIPCLKYSNADWIWFAEQDFFMNNWQKFYEDIHKAMEYSDAIGWWNETHFPYLHPCCFFIKREVLEKTHKDFRAHPEIPGCDHFAMITRDLESLHVKITKLQDLGYVEWENCFHLGGLTYPYQDWKNDGSDIFGVKDIEAFACYNYWSTRAPVAQNIKYVKMAYEIEQEIVWRFKLKEVGEKYKSFFRDWEALC